MRLTANATGLLGKNWFVPVLLVLLGIVFAQTRILEAGQPRSWEAALLFDALVTIPALFWLCYRASLTPGAMALRIVALQCSGLWLLGWIVPDSEQHLLPSLAPLRLVGLAVIVLFEARIMLALVRIVFKPGTESTDLEARGVPRWVARMMLLEARFWRWVFSSFRRDQ